MKPYAEIAKKHSPKEIAEALVFPSSTDKKQREDLLSDFRAIRKQLAGKQTAETKRISQLLQLKFIIEDYLQADYFNKDYFFGFFLKEYINRLHKKNKEFAEEINVNPTELSQVINKRRKPTEKLIYRLEIHSNRNFPAVVWFAVMEKERAYELSQDSSIIDSEKKHVKQKLEFSL